MIPSRSFFYFRDLRRAALLLCAVLLLLAPGCSRNSLNEKADALTAQALNAERQMRYADAEQLFNEALPVYAQADNPDKFNATTAALAALEHKRGKLSRAFMHFHASLSYFQQKNDADRITSLSISLADLYALTGRKDSAAMCAFGALKAASDAGNNAGKAASEYALGRIESMFRNPAAASAHFTAAARFAAMHADAPLNAAIALAHASALARLNKQDEAIRQISLAAASAASAGDASLHVTIKAGAGAVYLRLGLYDDAMRVFREGLRMDSTAKIPGMTVQLLCGIGEVFFSNYAHAEAREYYSKAYNRAIEEKNAAVMGYCLIRMGECEERELLHAPSASAVLRALSLYREAAALYTSDPSPQCTALAMLKSASLRAALHEDADAEPLFRAAFDLMRNAATQQFCSTEQFIVTDEMRLLPYESTCDDWWYRSFAAFLMHKRRIADALTVLVDGEAGALRHTLQGYPIAFQDSVRHAALGSYLAHARAAAVMESALMTVQSTAEALVDIQDADSLRALYRSMQSALAEEGGTILTRYPSLLPLITPPAGTTVETIESHIPAEGCLVSYASLGGRFYAIVVPARANALAVDLGPEAPIRSRIADYCSLLQHQAVLASVGQKTDDAAVRQSSALLYANLFQPIERHIARRIVVHMSEELGALPVHALATAGGKYTAGAYEITYAPLLNTSGMVRSSESPLRSVVAFGAPSAGNLESEYELRSIKNFYADASVVVAQMATENNFRNAAGDILHLSTFYGRNEAMGYSTFAVSGGSITAPESYPPASSFLMARPHAMWVIADMRRDTNLTSREYGVFAMMSGASRCVLQQYTSSFATSKEFNELFYTSILAHGDGRLACRDAIVQMQQRHANDAAYITAPFFLLEW